MNFYDEKLEQGERAQLAGVIPHPGWKVFEKLFKSEVDKFNLVLLNTPAASTAEVLAAHQMAKAAAQVYAGVMNRVSSEVELFVKAPRASDKPLDPTESLDMGDYAMEESEL